MTGVKLICAGKLKEDFYLKACQEYQKRLSAFCRLEVVEIPEDTRPGGLEREGDKILAAIPPQSYVVAMCIEGEEMSSRELRFQFTPLREGRRQNSTNNNSCFASILLKI